ncbi:MAG: P-loop NTPase [Dehalococcoidia bacterium]|nr:P-loop NTPase [Dehalococcoidia bacterium]
MGLIHCPMGAAYYDDEPCIDCGLCSAKTKEDMVEASKRIRDYLRAHAEKRRGPSKKIAVCGKGGTGKSTIVALMTNALRQAGYLVLVMDTDESNPGLYRLFGFDQQPRPLMALLERFSLGETKPETEWLKQDEILVQDIPSEYLLECDSLKFLMAGKIADPFQGCACSIADIARGFIEKLVLKDREIVLIDMEAGIESFGRGVERGVDTVLVVVEPSFESLALAEKISYMSDGIGVNKVMAIPNKVTSEKVEKRIIEELENKKIKVIGTIYFDSQINEASLEGKTLLGSSSAEEDIKRITRLLLVE